MTDNEIAARHIPDYRPFDATGFDSATKLASAFGDWAFDEKTSWAFPDHEKSTPQLIDAFSRYEEAWRAKPLFLSNDMVDDFLGKAAAFHGTMQAVITQYKGIYEVKRQRIYILPNFSTLSNFWTLFVIFAGFNIWHALDRKSKLGGKLEAKYGDDWIQKLTNEEFMIGGGFTILLFTLSFLLIGWIIHRISRVISKKKQDAQPRIFPNFVAEAESRLQLSIARRDAARAEFESEVRVNQALLLDVKKRLIDDHFEDRRSNRSIAERMAIIEAEARAAASTVKTLEEQHEKTETIRLKYARELVELQREVKAEANQDLTDKLALVQGLLGDSP